VKRRCAAREGEQLGNQRPRPCFNYVDVGSRARQAVLQRHDEAAATDKLDGFRESGVQV
jgi:hypothetical protein